MPDFLTILFIGLAALGGWLLAIGWRGRRVDNHPWCRKCRRDLQSVWPGAAKCPECGVDLERIDAVELGQRARRPVLAALGALILLCWAGWLGMGLWRSVKTVNWSDHKPDWWLMREAHSSDAETAAAALKTLRARMANDELSEATIARLVQHALQMQADDSTNWEPFFGQLIEDAWIDGALTPEQCLAFAQRSALFAFAPASEVVRQWDLSSVKLECIDTRTGGGELFYTISPSSLTIGELDIPFDPSESKEMRVSPRPGRLDFSLLLPVAAAPGEYEVRSTWRVQAQPGKAPGAAATWDIELAAPIKVLPPDADAPVLVIGPDADERLLACFRFEAIGFRLSPFSDGRAQADVAVLGRTSVFPFSAEVAIAGPRPITQRASNMRFMVGQSYRGVIVVPRLSDKIEQVELTLAPNIGRGRSAESWQLQQLWYGPPLSMGPIAVTWYDSIDDPNLPEDLRQRCMESGWQPVTPDPTEPSQ